ncbi:MAG: HlyU family transcriptional regulator [Pseudomonadota bacterium]
MSLLSKLFGGGNASAPAAEPIEYNGFSITPQPAKEGGRYRIGAKIEKDDKTHELIRADTLDDRAGADEASINKAKQLIDQMGDALFRN